MCICMVWFVRGYLLHIEMMYTNGMRHKGMVYVMRRCYDVMGLICHVYHELK